MASISKASEPCVMPSVMSLAAASVKSKSGLSWFDHPLNHKNTVKVMNALADFTEPITAVWLVGRPVNRELNGGLMHMMVKVQSKSVLVSIDFVENRGQGAFALKQRSNIGGEWDVFMKYEVTDPSTGMATMEKWKILASVMPHCLYRNTEGQYPNSHYDERYMSRHKRRVFKRQWDRLEKVKREQRDYSKFPKRIRCSKRVCDIGKFCKQFTADNKGYNVITKNCQQFAAELFAFLLDDEEYKEERERVFGLYQSPHDQQQWQKKKDALKKSKKSGRKGKGHPPKGRQRRDSRQRRLLQSEQVFGDLNGSMESVLSNGSQSPQSPDE